MQCKLTTLYKMCMQNLANLVYLLSAYHPYAQFLISITITEGIENDGIIENATFVQF